MKIRLIILLVIAAGAGAYLISMPRGSDSDIEKDIDDYGTPEANPNLHFKPLQDWTFDAPRATVEPQFHVQVEADDSQGRNLLRVSISEANGFFVERFRLRLVRTDFPEEELDVFEEQCYIKARETFVKEYLLNTAELNRLDGLLGKTGDWIAEVTWWGGVYTANPSTLPSQCELKR